MSDEEYGRIVKSDDEEEKLEKVRSCHKAAKQHQRRWRVEALEAYDFRDGRQWSEDDKATLEADDRPMVTFNRMSPYFDAVQGTEINNRQEIKYLGRTLGDSQQTELLTAAVKWVRDRTDAGDEESESFADLLAAGMGWVETRIEYDDDPDGKVIIERVDPLEMSWDPKARKKNLKDRNWHQRTRWLSKDEILDRWPKAELGTTSTPWGDETEDSVEPHNANLAFLYRENSTDTFDAKTGMYRVVQHQYWDYETVYRVADPMSGKIVTLTGEKWKVAEQQALDQGITLKSAKTRKKVYKFVFVIGDEIVEEGVLKCGFNILCMTGKRDQNTGLWYGLTRVMKDPQRWANKFLAQIMHIVNSNAKGGLLAETGAFLDPKKAEEDWSNPNSITLLKNGGLAKVKEKGIAQYPQGLDKLLQFAIASIPDATGINLEFMGMQDRAQANVLEQTRKKSAFVILAGFFDSLRLYRKEEGRLLAHFVKEYMNDGRIIRITTDQGEKPIPLQLTEDAIDYDVVVDSAPDSPNLKAEVWTDMKEMIPQFMKAGMPIPPSIFKYSPLPVEVANEFMAAQQGKLPPKAQQAMNQMKQQLQQLGQENHDLKQQAQIKMIQNQTKMQLGQGKNAIEAAKLQHGAVAHQADATMQAEMMKAQEEQDERAAMREIHAEIIKSNEKHRQDLEKQRQEFEHQMQIQTRDLIAASLQAEVKSAKGEVESVKASKVDEKAVKGEVSKVVKVVESQAKDIAALSKMLESLAKTVEKIANEPDDDPKKFEVSRDESGRIKTITAVH